MIALTLLLLAIGWLLVAAVAGFLAYKGTGKRWVHVATTLIVLWLPFWDVIPGWILYQKAVREVGGVRIYKTVEAEGYLDGTLTGCNYCWNSVKESKYKYVEFFVGPLGPPIAGSLVSVPGYHEFRLANAGMEGCERFELLTNVEIIRKNYGLQSLCVLVERRDKPRSRYEYSFGEDRYLGNGLFEPVIISWAKISDREMGEIIAEARQVHFVSKLGKWVGIPQWHYVTTPDGAYIELDVTNVIKPI